MTLEKKSTSKELFIMYVASLLFMMCNMLPNPIVAGYSVYLGASAALMSIIGGLNSFCALVSRPFVGNLSDILNKSKLMITGLLIMAAGVLLHLFAPDAYVLACGRIINGIGFTCCSVCMPAWIALKVPRENLGHAIGIYGTMNAISMAVAPTLGVFSYQHFSYRAAFELLAVLMVIAIVSVLLIKGDEETRKKATDFKRKFRLVCKASVPVSAISMLLCIPYFATQTYLVQYAETKGLAISVGLFFPVYAVILAVARTLIGRLVDRLPFKYFFWLAMVAMTAYPLVMNAMNNNLVMVIATICMVLGYGIIYPVCQTKAILVAGKGNEGLGNSTFFMGLDIGVTLGGVLGGVLYSKLPIGMFFPCLLFVIPLCILIYLFFVRNKLEENI